MEKFCSRSGLLKPQVQAKKKFEIFDVLNMDLT
jgi:hypothetical protein